MLTAWQLYTLHKIYPHVNTFKHNLFAENKTSTHFACWLLAWRRPTLAEAKPQLPSALGNLTAVFGMGTGVTSPPSLPDMI